jgi:hypothetical protein
MKWIMVAIVFALSGAASAQEKALSDHDAEIAAKFVIDMWTATEDAGRQCLYELDNYGAAAEDTCMKFQELGEASSRATNGFADLVEGGVIKPSDRMDRSTAQVRVVSDRARRIQADINRRLE